MFPGCPEYCNAEGTLSEYSRNTACPLDELRNFFITYNRNMICNSFDKTKLVFFMIILLLDQLG